MRYSVRGAGERSLVNDAEGVDCGVQEGGSMQRKSLRGLHLRFGPHLAKQLASRESIPDGGWPTPMRIVLSIYPPRRLFHDLGFR